MRAKDELAATGVLKKYKYVDTFIFEKSSHWRSPALENMMLEYIKERDRKITQESSLLLYDNYFLQYISLLLNYKSLERQGVLSICYCDIRLSRHASFTEVHVETHNKHEKRLFGLAS